MVGLGGSGECTKAVSARINMGQEHSLPIQAKMCLSIFVPVCVWPVFFAVRSHRCLPIDCTRRNVNQEALRRIYITSSSF